MDLHPLATTKLAYKRGMKNSIQITMRYKLTDKDYDELYLYLSPREIKEEYGPMSKSARWIQNYYRERGRKTWQEANQELKEFSYDVADIEVTEERPKKQKIVIRSFDNKKIVYFFLFLYIFVALIFLAR